MKRTLFSSITIAAALLSTPAFADCIEGVRKETPQEAAFYQKVQGTLRDALPAAPPGWTIAPQSNRSLGGLCKDTPEGGFSVKAAAKYTYRPPKAEADRMYAEGSKVQAEIDALEKLPPDLAKERQGWMDKSSEAVRAARQADKDGNKDLAKQKYGERDTYDRNASEVRSRHLASVRPQVDALRTKLAALNYAPRDVIVEVSVNDAHVETLDSAHASEIVVGKVPAPRSPGLKVHGVRMVFKGPAPQREELRSAVERAKMERLLE